MNIRVNILLLSLISQAGFALTPESCSNELTCFVPKSCDQPQPNDVFVVTTDDKDCEAHIMMKQYTPTKLLVTLKTEYHSMSITYEDSANIYEDDLLMGCELDDDNRIVSMNGIGLIEANWKSGISCQFIINQDPLFYEVPLIAHYGFIKRAFGIKIHDFFRDKARCDPSWLVFEDFQDKIDTHFIVPADTRYDDISCKADQTIVYLDSNGQIGDAHAIRCTQDAAGHWGYSVQKLNQNMETVMRVDGTSTDTFKVGCKRIGCTLCPSPICHSPACVMPRRETDDSGCHYLTCPGDRIAIDNEPFFFGNAHCKKFAHDDFRWNVNGVFGTKITCTKEVRCFDLKSTCLTCKSLASKGAIRKCDSGQIVKFKSTKKKISGLTRSLQCRAFDDEWVAEDIQGLFTISVPDDSEISCVPDTLPTRSPFTQDDSDAADRAAAEAVAAAIAAEAEEKLKRDTANVYIGVAVTVLIMIVVIAGTFLFFLILKPKYDRARREAERRKRLLKLMDKSVKTADLSTDPMTTIIG